MPILIVGLGNPGNEYLNTRHNMGRIMLEFIKKNYDFNVLRFESGALSSADMIISRTGYEVAEANLVQGKFDLVFRKVLLDFYRGKPLKLN